MALPSFNIVFYLVSLINSSLAILLGFFSSATTFGRRSPGLTATDQSRNPLRGCELLQIPFLRLRFRAVQIVFRKPKGSTG